MKKVCVCFIFALLIVVPLQSWGQITAGSTQPKKFEVMVGKSLTLTSASVIKRASVVAPEIADALVISQTQVYITGKAPGTTSLTFWGRDDHAFAVVNIKVLTDLSELKDLVNQLLPEEKNVNIKSVHNTIAITGSVTSSSSLAQIVDMAHSYAGKDVKVVNLLEVSGVQQIMLEVRVAEISHGNLKKMGINWHYLYKGDNYAVGAGSVGIGGAAVGALPALGVSQLLSILSNSTSTNTLFGAVKNTHNSASALIDALNEVEVIKVLAKPTLVTLNGKPAEFLAGGEVPIPVPQSIGVGTAGTITIEYKPFGVGLKFIPVVLNTKKINMTVSPEVSEPDFTNSIRVSGFVVPNFLTRRLSTTIELDDGQSFVIAGLLSDQNRKIISKFPLLGDIPILGALFRSTSWQKNETELIVVATPHLVKPVDMTKQSLPTDEYKEPSDFDFYLKGRSQGADPNYKPVW